MEYQDGGEHAGAAHQRQRPQPPKRVAKAYLDASG
jgi:hypothetical protein